MNSLKTKPVVHRVPEGKYDYQVPKKLGSDQTITEMEAFENTVPLVYLSSPSKGNMALMKSRTLEKGDSVATMGLAE